jgi:DNA-directed RNA polymerase sigma subunit (sigma70/sigma32)
MARPVTITQETIDRVIAASKTGASLRAIAEHVGISHTKVKQIQAENDCALTKRKKIDLSGI